VKKATTIEEKKNISDLTVPAFGYELIREELLSDFLGKDHSAILYWAGKRLARSYPLYTINEIKEFFINAGWGDLSVIEENKNEMKVELSSELISHRLKTKTNATFQLEAGFLAEQIQQQKKHICEAYEHPKKKDGKVQITIRWDNMSEV
jgi:predicted hydrocarbon binding protein